MRPEPGVVVPGETDRALTEILQSIEWGQHLNEPPALTMSCWYAAMLYQQRSSRTASTNTWIGSVYWPIGMVSSSRTVTAARSRLADGDVATRAKLISALEQSGHELRLTYYAPSWLRRKPEPATTLLPSSAWTRASRRLRATGKPTICRRFIRGGGLPAEAGTHRRTVGAGAFEEAIALARAQGPGCRSSRRRCTSPSFACEAGA